MKNYGALSLAMHKKHRGKLEVVSKVRLKNTDDLSTAYTPGVAEPCRKIAKKPDLAYEYTIKRNTVAVVTDGSSVLGLGNIGGLAGLPVMEGKCLLLKNFADVDAFPISLATQDPDEIVETIKNISPTFGAINLEDIAAPNCFYIEERLQREMEIPVFHDDQHGTAIVILAGLLNALKVIKKEMRNVRVVISGAGAAGIATAKLLLHEGVKDLILVDSRGAIYSGRKDLNSYKKEMALKTNKRKVKGGLAEALSGMDVFIGVSQPGIVTQAMIYSMAPHAIVFAMANPIPEIMPDLAAEAGAAIVATGRSDFPNQINNVLAFPGVLRGVLDARARLITEKMKIAAAYALASLTPRPTKNKIISSAFSNKVARAVAEAVKRAK
ncbi:NAD-dependent malic enzyme [Candidatus Peregrinibacteria bacterium CG11_big_fil_rev_8_21_14_0_20_46_8]|nr:MAG: NAD-dependent malic enzyme [Candidatus Peregrinibacteria bacterium CG11_big_fil_rev_8_21_14_0_20_46_8]